MMNQNDDYNLKLQLTQELERAVKGQKLNQELYDYLLSTLQYVLGYAKDNKIPILSPEHLVHSLDHVHKLMDSVNANHLKPYQPTLNTKNHQPSSEQNLVSATSAKDRINNCIS